MSAVFEVRAAGRTAVEAVTATLRLCADVSTGGARYTVNGRATLAGTDGTWLVEVIDIDGEGPDRLAARLDSLTDALAAMRADNIVADPADVRARQALTKFVAARPALANRSTVRAFLRGG